MDSELINGILALLGSLGGTFGGIMASAKLTTYRIEQLEKKVEKHNSVMERTFVLEEQMKVANHRIADLEENNK
jgi:hypothetical protein